MIGQKGKGLVIAVLVFLCVSAWLFSEGQKEDSVEVVTLFSTVGSYKELLDEQIEVFNNTIGAEKGMRLEITNPPGTGNDLTQMLYESSSPDAPDLYTLQPGQEESYIQRGWARALEDIPGVKDELERFQPYLRTNVHIFGGKTYCLPLEVLPIKMAYNKDLFRKAGIVDANGEPTPPETWDEVVEYAKRITAVGEGEAFGYGVTFNFGPYYWQRMVLKPFIASVGHGWFDHQTGRYDFTSFRPAIEAQLRIRDDESYFPGPHSIAIDPIRAQFSAGHIGMFVSPAYDIGVFNDQFPAVMDWDICDIPVQDPDNRYREAMLDRRNVSIGSMVSEDRMWAVVEAFKFMHSKELYAYLYANNKIIPHEQEVMDMAVNVQNKTGWKNMSDISKGFSIFPWPDSLLNIEGPKFADVFDSVWAGDVDLDVALADLDERYNAALDKAVGDGIVDLAGYMFDVDLSLK